MDTKTTTAKTTTAAAKKAKTSTSAKTTKTAKTASPAARAKRTQPEISFYLQYADREYSFAEIRQLVLDKCEAEEMDPKDLRIYVKPGDDKAYYTCAGGSSSIAL